MMKASVVVVALLCCCLPAYAAAGRTTKISNSATCTYIISVQTGTEEDAGTDSKISATFTSADGADQLYIDNLESWWIHGNPDPFENGNLDRFQGSDRCMDLCWMLLESDGSGNEPGWYVVYVGLQTFRNESADASSLQAASRLFDVRQWLATDLYPYQLFVQKDLCGGKGTGTGAAIV